MVATMFPIKKDLVPIRISVLKPHAKRQMKSMRCIYRLYIQFCTFWSIMNIYEPWSESWILDQKIALFQMLL